MTNEETWEEKRNRIIRERKEGCRFRATDGGYYCDDPECVVFGLCGLAATKVTKERRALALIEGQCAGMSYRPKPDEFSCWRCSEEETCKSAWDLYNTGGDCLEEK